MNPGTSAALPAGHQIVRPLAETTTPDEAQQVSVCLNIRKDLYEWFVTYAGKKNLDPRKKLEEILDEELDLLYDSALYGCLSKQHPEAQQPASEEEVREFEEWLMRNATTA